MSILTNTPLRTFMLGRLSVTVPEFMQPQVENFSYTWDSRTPNNESHYLGYPISLQEQPYTNRAHAEAEWHGVVETVRYKNRRRLLFEWDVSTLFGAPAYFLCFQEQSAMFHFYIIVRESQCMLHIVGRNTYMYPEKDGITDTILRTLADFYKKYKQICDIYTENIFYTYYGKIVNYTSNTNEETSLLFSSTDNIMRLVIYTDINPSGGTEVDLKKWMDRTGNPHSKMRKLPHFPGSGYYRYLKNKQGLISLLFDYYGPQYNMNIPSLSISATIENVENVAVFLEAWDTILDGLYPLQRQTSQR